jgi:competence protein ComEC
MARRKGRKRRKSGNGSLFVKALVIAAVLAAVSLATDKSGIIQSGDDSSQVSESVSDYSGSGSLTVEFIDVGQGDATLINSDGSYMLIDTGDRDSSNTLINHLKEDGVETIDYFVISHPHADHIGEAAEVVENFDIKTVIAPNVPDSLVPTSQTYENLLDAMDEKGLKFHAAKNETFTFGDCKVETWAADGDYDNVNNYSVILKLTDGGDSFLFGGDCEKEEEQEILANGADLSATVMKAAHHGSKTSSTSEWLSAVNPEYTVISCGADNSYGHPDSDTYKRISEICPNVYVTAECGTVTFTTDGNGVSCKTEK